MFLLVCKEISIGKRLKELRGSKSQEEVSTKLGISRARYSHYETDRVEPDIMLIRKMASYYKVTTDYLFGMTDIPNAESEEFKEYLNDPLTSIAFKDFENFSDEQKQEAIEMIKYIKFKEGQKEQ